MLNDDSDNQKNKFSAVTFARGIDLGITSGPDYNTY